MGDRPQETATEFVTNLEHRLANRIQLTTDGYKAYVEAVDAAFGRDVDYAMLAKIYAPSQVDLHKQVIFVVRVFPRGVNVRISVVLV